MELGPEPCACIEFDVQLTSDGLPVTSHDDTVDRTVTQIPTILGTTVVAEMSLVELQELEVVAQGIHGCHL